MNNYSKPLNQEEWSEHYNINILNNVVDSIKAGKVSIWSKELERICSKGSCLEIGCGTGISSLWLARNGNDVTALDYTESSVKLVEAAKRILCLPNLSVIQADATKELPFREGQFDYIFQAGLLEHFEAKEQIRLLTNWKKYGKHMVSMIPNASSIPYRVGKKILEGSGKWEYGLEIPKHSMASIFLQAGINVVREYSIGSEWAQRFLPRDHYIKIFFSRLEEDGYDLDEFMQGYLLVTIGDC